MLSGKLLLGMGDKLDPKKGTVLTAGGYAEAPAKMNHYAVATSPSVIQLHGMGPVEITYVDKADDPRNAAPRLHRTRQRAHPLPTLSLSGEVGLHVRRNPGEGLRFSR